MMAMTTERFCPADLISSGAGDGAKGFSASTHSRSPAYRDRGVERACVRNLCGSARTVAACPQLPFAGSDVACSPVSRRLRASRHGFGFRFRGSQYDAAREPPTLH
jgi:hypothetical protein